MFDFKKEVVYWSSDALLVSVRRGGSALPRCLSQLGGHVLPASSLGAGQRGAGAAKVQS